MKRREFIAQLAGAAAAWPVAAQAQRPAIPVIGSSSASPQYYADRVRAFHRGLNEAGYVEGQNVAIEYRWAEDDNSRLPALAAQLVQRQVTVIAAAGATPSALAAKSATSTIPIVFGIGADPIEIGLIPSLNRPGGNLTGITTLALELGPKRLELLHEIVPAATHIAVLNDPTGLVNAEAVAREQTAARKLGLEFDVLHASSETDFERAFATLARSRAGDLSEAKLTRRQRIRLLTRLNRLTKSNPIEAFSERGSSAHAELVDVLRQLASPVVPSTRA